MTVWQQQYDPSGQYGDPEASVHVEIQRHVPMFQKAEKTNFIPQGSLQLRGALREVLDFRTSLRREFSLVLSFDWVRRGVLHRIVAGNLSPFSEQQQLVIVALESCGMKSSCNPASLMWFDKRDRFS